METYKLPKDLLFGTATSSLQIEGGDTNNNWYRFCEQGKTKDGTHCIKACDHWNKYEEDIQIMKEMNQEVYRLSIEWSRIEPIESIFDEESLKHYRDEIIMLIKNGIKPLVTIHHFSNPIWFEDIGGWANPLVVDLFERYTEKLVECLGDIVSEWVTINEPNVYLEATYSQGNFPPNKPNFINYFKGLKNMSLAHIKSYKAIHRIRSENNCQGETRVGFAKHVRVFDPLSFGAKFSSNLVDYVFHRITFEAMIKGKFIFPIGSNNYPLEKGIYSDFLGINYYSRDIIKFSLNPARVFAKLTVKEAAPLNDMGWEIYPEGLYILCKKYFNEYNLPIFITENGICDSKDENRAKFIYNHLLMVKKLLDEGIKIERYYHWSLMDNFEWDFGLAPKFGLVEVNYDTQERRIKESGRFYAEISKHKEITDEMIKEYLVK